MLVEVEDQELNRLRGLAQDHAQADAFRKVWSEVLSGPDRMAALKLVKNKFPNTPIPELDTAESAAKPIIDELEKFKKEFADYRESVEKEKAERAEEEKKRSVESTIAGARRKLKRDGWDEEGIAEIEKLMQDRQIADYEVAAEYIRSKRPVEKPIANSYDGTSLNWFNPGDDAPDQKLIIENPNLYKQQMVQKFFADRQRGDMSAWR